MSTPSERSIGGVDRLLRSAPAMLDLPSIGGGARVARCVVVRARGLTGRDPGHGHALRDLVSAWRAGIEPGLRPVGSLARPFARRGTLRAIASTRQWTCGCPAASATR